MCLQAGCGVECPGALAFVVLPATVLCWTAENGWKRPRILAGSESDVRQWGRVSESGVRQWRQWPPTQVRPSGPCCFARFWSRDRWRKLGFLVGSESDVRHWQRSKKGPIRHALAGGFSVHKLIFLSQVAFLGIGNQRSPWKALAEQSATQNRNFTSVFNNRTSFRAKG